jgi:hypothetical protein
MAKWQINATNIQELTLEVEADSYEEALAIYESGEDIAEDYECVAGEFRLNTIVEIGE